MREAIAVAERLGSDSRLGLFEHDTLARVATRSASGRARSRLWETSTARSGETREGQPRGGSRSGCGPTRGARGRRSRRRRRGGRRCRCGRRRARRARAPPTTRGGGGASKLMVSGGGRARRGRRAGVTERECVGWDRAEASPAKVQDAAGTSGVERLVHRLGAHRRHRGAIRGCASRGGCAVKWSARPTMGCPPSRFLRRLF